MRFAVPSQVNDLAVSKDGAIIVAAASDSFAYVISRKSGNTYKTKHNNAVNAVDFEPNSRNFITASANVARFWNADSTDKELKRIFIPNASIATLRVAPDGKHFAVGCWDGTARTFDLWGQENQVVNGHNGIVKFVNYSPDGIYLLSGDGTGKIRISYTLEALLKMGRIYRIQH